MKIKTVATILVLFCAIGCNTREPGEHPLRDADDTTTYLTKVRTYKDVTFVCDYSIPTGTARSIQYAHGYIQNCYTPNRELVCTWSFNIDSHLRDSSDVVTCVHGEKLVKIECAKMINPKQEKNVKNDSGPILLEMYGAYKAIEYFIK